MQQVRDIDELSFINDAKEHFHVFQKSLDGVYQSTGLLSSDFAV
jgi:hypothetical protein